MAVAITKPVTDTAVTTNAGTYAMSAFTPTGDSLLVLFIFSSGTTSFGNVTGGGLVWTIGRTATASGDTMYMYWAKTPASPISTTITFGCSDDAATGNFMCVLEFTDVDQSTRNPIKQTTTNQASSTNANVTFATALDTNNGYAIAWAGTLVAGASVPPTSWTEDANSAIINPARNFSVAHRATGETGTTYTFVNLTTAWIAIGCEVYASGAGTVLVSKLALVGVG